MADNNKKLVDAERLAKLAKALDDRAKAGVGAEKARAEEQEAAIREEVAEALGQYPVEADPENGVEAVEGAGIRGDIADVQAAVEAEEERAKGEEQRIEGKFDKAVQDEKERAEGVEGELAGRLDVLEGEGEGSVKKAVADLAARHDEEMDAVEGRVADLEGLFEGDNSVDAKIEAAKQEALDAVQTEKERAEGVEGELDGRIAANEAFVAAQPAIDSAQNDRIKALEDDAPVKQAAIEAAQAAADQAQDEVDLVEERATALEGRMDAAEEDIARLDGAVDVEGSVKKQIKDAIDEVNGAAEELEGRVEVLEGEMDAIEAVVGKAAVEADENGEGAQDATGLHKLIADEDARVLAEAKKHADDAITALVDSAPDAMNTLNELAKAINDNQDVYDAYVEEHAQAMAQQKTDLQAEIDADVKVEADRAVAREAELQGEIDAVEGRMDTAEADIDALEAKVGHDKVEGEAPQDATGLFLEVDQARAAADQAQTEVDAVEERMTDAEGRLDVLEQNAAQAAIDMENTVKALQAEIDADVKVEADRAAAEEAKIREDFAAADEALHATIKNEMAAVIQSLVAEITEDGKLRIALGGVEGDDVLVIREQEIPFVTDAEIDAIIAGLDAVEGE